MQVIEKSALCLEDMYGIIPRSTESFVSDVFISDHHRVE